MEIIPEGWKYIKCLLLQQGGCGTKMRKEHLNLVILHDMSHWRELCTGTVCSEIAHKGTEV